jgi:hypothetical protein
MSVSLVSTTASKLVGLTVSDFIEGDITQLNGNVQEDNTARRHAGDKFFTIQGNLLNQAF